MGRRSALTLAMTFAGTVLMALIPASAAAGTMPASHIRMTHQAMVRAMEHVTHADMLPAIIAQATPPPRASMAPRAEPKQVQAGPELRKVLESIMCQCGCNLTVYACEGTMVCDVSTQMRADAERMLASGMTGDETIQAFAADYGEAVLAAPTKTGFNLTAWVLPFVVLAAGGLIVAIALRAWRPKAAGGPTTEETLPQVDSRYLDEVERELEQED